MNRYLRSLIGLSLLVGFPLGSIEPIFAQSVPSTPLPAPLPSPSRPVAPITPPLKSNLVLNQGNQILLNGKTFPVPWQQWDRGAGARIAISDTGAMALLGVGLLSSNQPNRQPVQWFTLDNNESQTLDAQFASPYRYLDVSDLLKQANANISINGKTLSIDTPPVQLENLRVGSQVWGKRLVLDLSRPVVWQISQNKTEGVITVEGNASPDLMARFAPTSSPSPTPAPSNGNEDDLGTGSANPGSANTGSGVSLEQAGNQLKIKIDLPPAQGLQVFSLSNPPRLVVDVRPDNKQPKEITWLPGLIWRQQVVSLGTSQFPVSLIEVDLRSQQFTLKPITSNPQSQIGTAPIVSTAIASQASAAINAGFFNRNNQLPLGAIRRDNRWLSGPILNRGAIAWDNQGKLKVDRLSLAETVTNAVGKKWVVSFVNSGYVQAGIVRYTPDWGARYTPLSDDETIIVVENDKISDREPGGKAGINSFPIPREGYLLIIRKSNVSDSTFPVGSKLTLESKTTPADFLSYPNIVGAGPLLIKNRQIVLKGEAENFTPGFLQQQASRSAIGRTAKGTVILVAVHNRINGKGATLAELANIMQALGAIDALNLDGGSSTSLSLGGQLIDRSPVTAARVHNGIGVFVAP